MAQVLYATAINLRDAAGINELVQVATPENVALLNPVTFSGYIDAAGVGATGDYLLAYNALMAAITNASAVIDTRLRARYTLPLTVVPAVLTDYCVRIARFYLHNDRATDEIRYRYEYALKDLDAVAAEKIDIGAVGTNNTGQSTAGLGIASSAPARDNTYASVANFQSAWPVGAYVPPCR